MSTSLVTDNKPQSKAETKPKEKKKGSFGFFFSGGSPVSTVMDALNSVDTSSPDAEENAHSISDGDGGRIELNQDGSEVIKK